MKKLVIVEQTGPMFTLLMRNLALATEAEITATEDYRKAATLIAGGGFDAALIALNFTTGAGLKLVKTLRKAKVVTKLILMSTGDAATFKKEAIDTGADAFIEKSDCTQQGLKQLFQSLNLA